MNIDNIADFNNEGDFLHTILLEQIFGKILELENLINVKKIIGLMRLTTMGSDHIPIIVQV